MIDKLNKLKDKLINYNKNIRFNNNSILSNSLERDSTEMNNNHINKSNDCNNINKKNEEYDEIKNLCMNNIIDDKNNQIKDYSNIVNKLNSELNNYKNKDIEQKSFQNDIEN
jgi:hypothetical protein